MQLRPSIRSLLRAPGFSLTVLLTLAVGIGATTAIYSLLHQMLVEPLPVHEPGRLVNLDAPGYKWGLISGGANFASTDALFTHEMFEDLQTSQDVFTGLAAYTDGGFDFGFREATKAGSGSFVSGSYFDVLGLTPAVGRLLQPQDTAAIGGSPIAVLAYDFWQREFNGDLGVVGEILVANGQQLEIVGVAPRGFSGNGAGWQSDVFVPYTMRWALTASDGPVAPRRDFWIGIFGRLQPGMTIERAESGINALYRSLLADVVVPTLSDHDAELLDRIRGQEIVLAPGNRGRSGLSEQFGEPTTLLFALSCIVLAIACVNVAGLLLVRGAARTGQVAIRTSIGATRGSIVRELLFESSMLAIVGGALGIFVAFGTMKLIERFVPADAAAGLDFTLSPTTLVFTIAATALSAVIFGTWPAWVASRVDPAVAMKVDAVQASGSRGTVRLRSGLSAAQIALSMVLLVLAVLFARSLVNIARVDVGIDTDSLLTFTISPLTNGYPADRIESLAVQLESAIAAEPGVAEVATSTVPLLQGWDMNYAVSMEGFEWSPGSGEFSAWNVVSPRFFASTGIGLLRGRPFTDQDRAGTPPVAIVNQSFVRKFELGSALGAHFSLPLMIDDLEIVGVVADAKYADIKRENKPQFFTARAQSDDVRNLSFYVRTSLPPEQFMARLPEIVAEIVSGVPMRDLRTMASEASDNVYLDRLTTLLIGAFAIVASLLAGIGLYGLLAYSVQRRRRELGLRLALGATPSELFALVARQVGVVTAVGAGIGAVAGIAIGRTAESLLFGLSGLDALSFAAAGVVIVLICFAAGLRPARQAASVEPMTVLRHV